MSIFKFNYEKEGKGIDKGAPERNIFYTYFESFIRNFWNLLKVNFLYIIASIPMIVILAFLFAGFVFPHIEPVLTEYISSVNTAEASQTQITYTGVLFALFIMELLLMIGSGPASAAFAYATKCMAVEEHVWIWSDFKGKFIENFKQSIIVVIIDIIVVVLVIFAMAFYTALYQSTANILYFILFSLLLAFSVLYIFMHGYIYQFIVTFDNKLLIVYKNAFILAIAKLPQNLFLTAIYLLFTYFVFTVINPVLAIILTLIGWYAIFRYPMEFYAARTLRKIINANSQSKGTEE